MAEEKNITSMVITVVVALIVTGAVLVPITQGLSGDDDGSMVEGPVLYTNEGDFYYAPVTPVTETVITLTGLQDEFDTTVSFNLAINDAEEQTIGVEWLSENSWEVTFYPLFIFNTSDGKLGMEGFLFGSLGPDGMDSEYAKRGSATYCRFVQGETEPREYLYIYQSANITDTSTITVSGQNITYDFPGVSPSEFPEPIDGNVVLGICNQEDGTWVRGYNVGVLDNTQFYCGQFLGSESIETDPDLGESVLMCGDLLLMGTRGTVSTITSSSNGFYIGLEDGSSGDCEPFDSLDIQVNSTDGDDGLKTISYLTITGGFASSGSAEFNPYMFIVPVEIREQIPGEPSDSSTFATILSVIPIFVILAILLYAVQYLRKPESGTDY